MSENTLIEMPDFIKYRVVRDTRSIEELFKLADANGGYIAGSYASWLAGRTGFEPNDIDIFTTNQLGGDAILEALPRFGLECTVKTEFYSNWTPTGFSSDKLPVQVINPIAKIDSAWKIITRFDFNVCRAALTSLDEVLGDKELLSNEGFIRGINGYVRTVQRIAKYTARGVVFSENEIRKVFLAWSKLDNRFVEKILLDWEKEGLDLSIGGSKDDEEYL